MTGIVGAVLEAWDELRIHRVRVLLALIGVACAVTAITGITAAVTMVGQAMQEETERMSGRDTTLQAWSMGSGNMSPAEVDAAVDGVTERHDISYHSVQATADLKVRGAQPGDYVEWSAVDVDHETITRQGMEEGRWFSDTDTERLAPVLVVNQAFLDTYADGASATTHPTVVIEGETPVAATVIGEIPVQWNDEGPRALLLFDQAMHWFPDRVMADAYRFWVPPELAEEFAAVLPRDLAAAGVPFDVQPPQEDPLVIDRVLQYLVLGVGGFALLLGGLGLLNIALVTVRYRIREIGIRRSFGATSGRVFFGVLMESVVATTVAGVVGVVIAVAIIKNIPIDRIFGRPIDDLPGFPFDAALVGMACAIGIGALAGLIPAIYAVRVKVIDAIRY
ncbi:putative ABC transport system permease protein [Promicromonospora umidemergens]|uniref:ABC transport system permease protein n=1 Tax=Promicromonospora umidemergens TaxID=629679 RepID=A0ABP8Y6S3_9MICO|nr:ABC transporter permease [Promicromonospora umidemergens]MCP2282487.1 putative ABC transport system permease protein [Promicromonospora umidemergens]